MRRRTLDVLFSAGGAVLAVLLLVLGTVLIGQANFARTYVADQLAEQKINFKPAEALTEQEAQYPCLVEYAGQPLTTGKQAECYANDFIGLHLKDIPNSNGMTYAELGTPERELRTQVAEARAAGAPNVAALEAELAGVSAARDTVFKGETLRGLLLTTYGFSILGEKAALAATVMFALAAILGLLSIAGFVHAFVTSKDQRVRIPRDLVDLPAQDELVAAATAAAAAKRPPTRRPSGKPKARPESRK